VSTFVALLRGINVGGHNVIAMTALVETFAAAGYADARTYIQSGNVIFEARTRDARALETKLARALAKAHTYEARVVVRSRDEMAAIVAGMPKAWRNPVATKRYNVLFLGAAIDAPAIVDELARRGLDQLAYQPGVVYSTATAGDAALAALGKVSSYREITVRNLNTTTKILERM
jgi:uncharacterized protein (DUF1697 family)